MLYKHCNMKWECDENHWEGDVCLVCGEKIKPEKEEEIMPKQSIPTSLDQEHVDFINRTGVGKNFSKRLRSILEKSMESTDTIANRPGAKIIFKQTEDGEKIWAKELPFPFNKKSGYKELAGTARAAGFVCQEISTPETGHVEVWISTSARKKDCDVCFEQIKKVIY